MAPDTRKTGTIARLVRDRVFGFITCPEDQRDYFFHQAHLEGCSFAQLEVGHSVSFILVDGKKGIEAQQVQPAILVRTTQGTREKDGNR
jgi:CspA family cold shock protein